MAKQVGGSQKRLGFWQRIEKPEKESPKKDNILCVREKILTCRDGEKKRCPKNRVKGKRKNFGVKLFLGGA